MSVSDASACALGLAVAAIKNAQKDADVLERWVAVLTALVPSLPPAVLETDVCELGLQKGQVDASVVGFFYSALLRSALRRVASRRLVFFARRFVLCVASLGITSLRA